MEGESSQVKPKSEQSLPSKGCMVGARNGNYSGVGETYSVSCAQGFIELLFTSVALSMWLPDGLSGLVTTWES